MPVSWDDPFALRKQGTERPALPMFGADIPQVHWEVRRPGEKWDPFDPCRFGKVHMPPDVADIIWEFVYGPDFWDTIFDAQGSFLRRPDGAEPPYWQGVVLFGEQLQGEHNPDTRLQDLRELTESWDDVRNMLRDHDRFGYKTVPSMFDLEKMHRSNEARKEGIMAKCRTVITQMTSKPFHEDAGKPFLEYVEEKAGDDKLVHLLDICMRLAVCKRDRRASYNYIENDLFTDPFSDVCQHVEGGLRGLDEIRRSFGRWRSYANMYCMLQPYWSSECLVHVAKTLSCAVVDIGTHAWAMDAEHFLPELSFDQLCRGKYHLFALFHNVDDARKQTFVWRLYMARRELLHHVALMGGLCDTPAMPGHEAVLMRFNSVCVEEEFKMRVGETALSMFREQYGLFENREGPDDLPGKGFQRLFAGAVGAVDGSTGRTFNPDVMDLVIQTRGAVTDEVVLRNIAWLVETMCEKAVRKDDGTLNTVWVGPKFCEYLASVAPNHPECTVKGMPLLYMAFQVFHCSPQIIRVFHDAMSIPCAFPTSVYYVFMEDRNTTWYSVLPRVMRQPPPDVEKDIVEALVAGQRYFAALSVVAESPSIVMISFGGRENGDAFAYVMRQWARHVAFRDQAVHMEIVDRVLAIFHRRLTYFAPMQFEYALDTFHRVICECVQCA